MARRRRGNGGGSGGGHDSGGMMRWLITYADLITLLLVFFVVLYAMSSVDAKKYENLTSSLRQALRVEGSRDSVIADRMGTTFLEAQSANEETDKKSSRSEEDAAFQKIIDEIRANATDDEMRSMLFVIDERGLVISFMDTLLFDLGRANLRSDATAILNRVADALRVVPNILRVEGHTDNLPIATVQYPSNWELSAARAINVTRHFITADGLDPRRFSATGYGEYRPVAPNSTDEGRSKNRRVDIVVLRSAVNVFETR